MLHVLPLLIAAIAAAAGPAGESHVRYELTLERVLHGNPPRYATDFVAADAVPRHVRRFTEFSGDVSGRYLEALSVVARLSGQSYPQVNAVATAVVGHQRADGHFGEPFADGPITQQHMAMLWGNGRLLVGLVEAQRVTGRADILAAARRLGDFFVAVAPRLNDPAVRAEYSGAQVAVGYICWTQIIEGLVGLHEVTRDPRYLELGRQVAAMTGRHPSQHSHGYLTSLRGIVRLHEATGDPALLAQVEKEWEGLVASGNVLVHGAVPEAFKPIANRDEGCSEADWLRLNLALWTLTSKPRYLEHAERTLFNEFSFNQFRSGDFGHRGLTETGVSAESARAWWCCTLHGLRAFPDLFHAVFSARGDALRYDLPISGEGESNGLSVVARSHLERDGTVRLRVTAAPGAARDVAIRVPAWAERVEVSLAGRPIDAPAENGRLAVRRAWKAGDELTVRYVLRTATVPHPEDASLVAVFHGPWLLGVDRESSPAFFDEPFRENRIVLPASGDPGHVRLAPAAADRAAAPRTFTVPVARFRLRYLPGGYPVQPQEALLRPIAEQTSLPDTTAWVFYFRVGREGEPAK